MKLLILADEVGEKLWPITKEWFPKGLLSIFSSNSLLYETIGRSLAVTGGEGKNVVVVVPSESIEPLVVDASLQLFGIPNENIIPVAGNLGTAATINLACKHMLTNGIATPDEQVFVTTVDQFMWPVSNFMFHQHNMVTASKADPDSLYIMGILAAAPSDRHNYIVCGEDYGIAGIETMSDDGETPMNTPVCKVEEYHPRPMADDAVYLVTQDAMWDTYNYMWRVDKFIETTEVVLSHTHKKWVADTLKGELTIVKAPKVSFSTEVIPTIMDVTEVRCISLPYIIWTLLDNWIAVKHLLFDSDLYQPEQSDEVVQVDAQRNLIYKSPGKRVAVFGVSDLIVIDTPEALLVGTPGGIYEHL